MIPLSGRVPRRDSEPFQTRVDDGGGYGTFHGWRLGSLGYSRGTEYIGGRVMSVGTRGAHTMTWRGQRGGAAMWCGCLLGPFRVSFGLRDLPGKIGTSGFVASNSENISNTAFLKPKADENMNRRSGILSIF